MLSPMDCFQWRYDSHAKALLIAPFIPFDGLHEPPQKEARKPSSRRLSALGIKLI